MSENIERIINYNIMKKYLLGILFILTIINMVESRLTADHENKVNLKTLLEASSASAAGEYSCICVKCPEEEHGCLYYDYSVPADPNNPGNKTGYINDGQSHFCPCYQGRGWVEKHAIDVGLNCY